MITSIIKTFRTYNLKLMTKEERRVYYCWVNIKYRCFNKRARAYSDYGGRGILLSDEFVQDFAKFYEHVGPRPNLGESLDRIDNDKGYERGNLRWANKPTQMRNRRCTLMIERDGNIQCVQDWADQLGIDKVTLWGRYKRGLTGESLFAPSLGRGKRVFETIDGITLSLSDWAKKTGLRAGTIIARYHKGWRGKELLITASEGSAKGASKRPQNQKREVSACTPACASIEPIT